MMSDMAKLVLFSRPGCHLCDEAAALLTATAPFVELEVTDIEPDLALVTRYGTRVPVLLRTDTGAELDWPFAAGDLSIYLQAHPSLFPDR